MIECGDEDPAEVFHEVLMPGRVPDHLYRAYGSPALQAWVPVQRAVG